MKYYSQQGVLEERPVQAGNFKIFFESVMFFAGQWWGVFGTDNEEVIAAMDNVVGQFGVKEISEEEYVLMSKKKGTRQTNTWRITEAVSGEVPSPQQSEKSDAVSVDEAPEHDIDDLLSTKQRDASTASPNYVSSQGALAEVLGVSLLKIRDLSKIEGNPGKADNGYNIPQWEQFLNTNP